MSRKPMLFVIVSLLIAACGGGGVGEVDPDSVFEGIGDAAESGTIGGGGDGTGPASLEDPTPEAPGSLEPNTIRIGSNVWSPPHPSTTGQCFTQKGEGGLPDSGVAWGDLDDEGSRFAFDYNQDGSFEGEVSGSTMFWVAGVKDGSELTIDLDFETSTISGEGLFYNGHTNEWAHGSFSFTCEDGG